MAIPTVAELETIIKDIEILINDGINEQEFKKLIEGKDFNKIYEYVNENRTIPDSIHKEGSNNKSELLFGTLIEKLQKAENAKNRRNAMVGREKEKDPKIKQAKQMRDIILGLKGRIIDKEIEEEEFDFEEYKEIKEQEIAEIQGKIDENKDEIKFMSEIKNVTKTDKDLKEYIKYNNMKKAIDEYEKIRKELENENKKSDSDKDLDKIEQLEEKMNDAKVAIGFSNLANEFKTIKINGKDVSIVEAIKDNKDISGLYINITPKMNSAKTNVNNKGVNDIFNKLTDKQKEKVAEVLGKTAPYTLEDSDITVDNLTKLIDETSKDINKRTKQNKKNVKERDVKKDTVDEIGKMAILKDVNNLDRNTLYKNYAGSEEKNMISVLDTRKGRIDFWKQNVRGPFKWIQARFKARKGNIAETKAIARGSIVDKMIETAKANKNSYQKNFRESIKVGMKNKKKDRIEDLDKEEIYANMEKIKNEQQER